MFSHPALSKLFAWLTGGTVALDPVVSSLALTWWQAVTSASLSLGAGLWAYLGKRLEAIGIPIEDFPHEGGAGES